MGGKIQKSGELNKANGHLYVHNDCNHSHVEKDLNHDKPTYKGCGHDHDQKSHDQDDHGLSGDCCAAEPTKIK